MFRRRKLALAAAAAASLTLGLTAPAHAQLGPPIDEHTTVVEALVVKGMGGPPWWKVYNGTSAVYVLAAPGALPFGYRFDERRLNQRLKDANELILPPGISYWTIGAFALPQSKQLIKDVTEAQDRSLEPNLPADLRARFVAARGRLAQPETRYGALPPGLAGMLLAADVEKRRRPPGVSINARPLDDIVETAARAANVRVHRAKTYGGPAMAMVLDEARKPNTACLAAILDHLDEPPAPIEDRIAIVDAWAEGDVRPLLDNLRRTGSKPTSIATVRQRDNSVSIKFFAGPCMDQMPRLRIQQQQFLTDEVDAIAAALERKGHSVAVVDAGSLLITGGVLDQLRHRGFTITAPDSVE